MPLLYYAHIQRIELCPAGLESAWLPIAWRAFFCCGIFGIWTRHHHIDSMVCNPSTPISHFYFIKEHFCCGQGSGRNSYLLINNQLLCLPWATRPNGSGRGNRTLAWWGYEPHEFPLFYPAKYAMSDLNTRPRYYQYRTLTNWANCVFKKYFKSENICVLLCFLLSAQKGFPSVFHQISLRFNH